MAAAPLLRRLLTENPQGKGCPIAQQLLRDFIGAEATDDTTVVVRFGPRWAAVRGAGPNCVSQTPPEGTSKPVNAIPIFCAKKALKDIRQPQQWAASEAARSSVLGKQKLGRNTG
jgi:hypothetical protein